MRKGPDTSIHPSRLHILLIGQYSADDLVFLRRPEVADQIEIVCARDALLEHREEAIPPTSTHSDSPGKRPWDRL